MKLYNTLSRQKEDFKPLKSGQVGIYSCGPTVYDHPHIGNLRSYTFADTLNRYLKGQGFAVKHIINITDVGHLTSDADTGEDKVEKEAKKTGQSAEEIISKYSQVFFSNLTSLNIDPDNYFFPRATEHIEEQIDLIKKLEAKGYTYLLADGLYFDTAKFPDYNKLSKIPLTKMKADARIESVPGKKNISDFALWKLSKPTETRLQEWPSPWGVGFPGWHIECSAMSIKYLGEHFDIHTGGTDHIPVHHTNEIAQSECATGQTFANYWLHNAFLINADDSKMSKSSGTFITLAELEEQGFEALDFRYLMLNTHYRKEIKFSFEALTSAANARKKLKQFLTKTPKTGRTLETYRQKFIDALSDDLNTPIALAVVWEMLSSTESEADKAATLLELDKYLGILSTQEEEPIPDNIQQLVAERELARQNNDWKKADELRAKITEAGFTLEDTPTGPIVHR